MNSSPHPPRRAVPCASLRALSCSSLLSATLSLSATLTSCLSPAPSPPISVSAVTPNPLTPGEEVTITGEGFSVIPPNATQGASPAPSGLSGQVSSGQVSIGGRPLEVIEWGARQVRARLPLDTPRGEALLVVSARELISEPHPVVVAGDLRGRVGAPPQLDPPTAGATATPTGGAPTPLPTGSYTPDAPADIGLSPTLTAPAGAGGPLELHLTVTLGERAINNELWGVATHLTFEGARLRYLGAVEAQGRLLQATEPQALPGRVALYRADIERGAEAVLTLRFEVIGGEEALLSAPLRFDFVPRFSGARAFGGRPLLRTWSGGTLTYVR